MILLCYLSGDKFFKLQRPSTYSNLSPGYWLVSVEYVFHISDSILISETKDNVFSVKPMTFLLVFSQMTIDSTNFC